MPFTEDLIYFLWKFRLFRQQGLRTVRGEPLEILSAGIHNRDSGADFENIKIRIDGTLWVGNAEAHIRSSDWDRHRHRIDRAYNNVVLHVVYEHDKEVLRNDGTEIPTLELKPYIDPGMPLRYQELMQNLLWIPCEKQIHRVEEFHIQNWLGRVLIERLQEKSKAVMQLLEECKGSWEDTFYVQLARNFGFKVNTLPFELLARSLPQQVLARHRHNPLQVEALVFGQAGFLPGSGAADGYQQQLLTEYAFLKAKYKLEPLGRHLWKFMRLRPANFPTIRLAQFAALAVKSRHLFSAVMETADVEKIEALFKELPVNSYWKTHYRFGKETAKAACRIGAESIQNILLNTVSVVMFAYGNYLDNEELKNRAVILLETIPFETNQVTRRFKELGIRQGNADRSQALIQLKKAYCDLKNCLNCAIGAKILNTAFT